MARVESQGLYLQMGDGASPEEFDTIAEICDMPPFAVSKSLRDRTCLDDTVRQLYPGMEEPPSITVTMFWDPTDSPQNALYDAYTDETEDNYQILCPDSPPSATWSFSARISGFSTPYGGVEFQLTTTITKG